MSELVIHVTEMSHGCMKYYDCFARLHVAGEFVRELSHVLY